MLRLFQHLLPRALAWRTTVDTTLRRYVQGLAGFAGEVRLFIDLAYRDLFPEDTRELPAWEDQFALVTDGGEVTRRARLAAAWQAQGGQSPDYIETQLQLAGFAIWIHEWWESGPPYVARDPRDYTSDVLLGFYQCEGSSEWECFDPGPGEALAPHCDATLVNDPGYIVNLDLTRRAPPPIPSDPAFWPYFLYFGGETFPDPAYIEEDRVDELKAKILQLRPSQQWAVLIIETFAAGLLYRFSLAIDDLITYEAGTEDDLRRIESQRNIARLGGSSVQALSASRPVATTFPEGRVPYFNGLQNIASDLPNASWNALHSTDGVITLAFRFRPLDAAASHQLINTSGATKSNPGFDITFAAGGVPTLTIGRGGGLSTVLTAGSWGVGSFTVVVVKNGLDVDLYFEDMSTPAASSTLAAASDSNAASALTIGGVSGTNANAWIPEVQIYDFAATEDQRDEIAAELGAWVMAPTLAEYVSTMAADGLAHFFDGNDIAIDGSAWPDAITATNMTMESIAGGSATKGTLDGHAALVLNLHRGLFHAAAALANGTNTPFSIVCYAELPVASNQPLWRFHHPAGPDSIEWVVGAATTRVDRTGGGSTASSAAIPLSASDRFYSHVFRAGSDAANLVRVDATQNAPALATNPITTVQWRISGVTPVSFAFLALFSRALNEGDLRALNQVIEREL